MSVYAVLIDFNEIKSWKVIQQVKSFYRNAKVLLSVDFLLVNVVRGIKSPKISLIQAGCFVRAPFIITYVYHTALLSVFLSNIPKAVTIALSYVYTRKYV